MGHSSPHEYFFLRASWQYVHVNFNYVHEPSLTWKEMPILWNSERFQRGGAVRSIEFQRTTAVALTGELLQCATQNRKFHRKNSSKVRKSNLYIYIYIQPIVLPQGHRVTSHLAIRETANTDCSDNLTVVCVCVSLPLSWPGFSRLL